MDKTNNTEDGIEDKNKGDFAETMKVIGNEVFVISVDYDDHDLDKNA